jgi:hypothetical protein
MEINFILPLISFRRSRKRRINDNLFSYESINFRGKKGTDNEVMHTQGSRLIDKRESF